MEQNRKEDIGFFEWQKKKEKEWLEYWMITNI